MSVNSLLDHKSFRSVLLHNQAFGDFPNPFSFSFNSTVVKEYTFNSEDSSQDAAERSPWGTRKKLFDVLVSIHQVTYSQVPMSSR
ncbi:hypothetical protein STEG23_008941 [Scotinomys teguina]